MRLKPFAVLLFPIAHIALDRHRVIGRDFVPLQGARILRGLQQCGPGMLDQHLDDLGFVFAVVHGGEYEIAPTIELFA